MPLDLGSEKWKIEGMVKGGMAKKVAKGVGQYQLPKNIGQLTTPGTDGASLVRLVGSLIFAVYSIIICTSQLPSINQL
jgi:hypothetical protein